MAFTLFKHFIHDMNDLEKINFHFLRASKALAEGNFDQFHVAFADLSRQDLSSFPDMKAKYNQLVNHAIKMTEHLWDQALRERNSALQWKSLAFYEALLSSAKARTSCAKHLEELIPTFAAIFKQEKTWSLRENPETLQKIIRTLEANPYKHLPSAKIASTNSAPPAIKQA